MQKREGAPNVYRQYTQYMPKQEPNKYMVSLKKQGKANHKKEHLRNSK